MEVLGLTDVPFWLICSLLVIVLLYIYGTIPFAVLKRHGIQHPPVTPFMGNYGQMFSADYFGKYDLDCMRKYGKIWGLYEGRVPTVVFHDPDLVKILCVKEFQHFSDRRDIAVRGIIQHSVFDAKGSNWKRIRSLLTPFFTTGKLRQRVTVINRCCDNLVAALDRQYDSGNSWEAKSLASCYSMDCIASTGFGIDLDSAKNPDDPFIVNGRKVDNIKLNWFLLTSLFPFTRPVIEACGVTMFQDGIIDFFTNVTYEAIKRHQESDQKKRVPDFVDAMMKAHMEELDHESRKDLDQLSPDKLEESMRKSLSEDEIIGNALLLFLAGFDTTATTISFILYLLALNQDCQEKAYEEALDILGQDEPTYESVAKLEYIDMCMNEALRLYPPAARFDRLCTADTVIGGVTVPKGSLATIPVWAIHHDPEFFPEPEEFDPERFFPDLVKLRHPYTFLPFGHGPRMCIGNRLAIMEVKLAVARILLKYRIVKNEKTQIPIKLKKKSFLMQTESGAWLSAEPRDA